MAKLTAGKRDKLPGRDFGLSGSRKYPMEDKQHAGDAKARADQQYEGGRISGGQYERIISAANRVLDKGRGK